MPATDSRVHFVAAVTAAIATAIVSPMLANPNPA